MKCPKCGNEKFYITIIARYEIDYSATIDDGVPANLEFIAKDYIDDIGCPNMAECTECGEFIAIPGQLSDEKQNAIRQRAINKWEIPGLYILNHAKVEQGVDGYRHGYYVDACVWVGEEEV